MEPLLPDDPDRIGPNQLIARLGAGGMGQVYLARTRGERPVAVKVIHENLASDREFRARFGREVETARRVNGAYTAPLLDADPSAPIPWLATAYLPGLSLTEAVVSFGVLPVATGRALGAALAEALVAIHRSGVVHRDLKPPNVLLTSVGPRVIDFGIARAADFVTLTGTGVIIGTPGYLAPEQITGAPVGSPVDVFALGALLVYALTGVGPFGTGGSAELLLRSVKGEPALDLVPDPALRAQLAACLAKSPEQRPTPAHLLEMWASSEAVTLDGVGWLPPAVASEIQRAAAALPRLTATPWRMSTPWTSPPGGAGPHGGAALPAGATKVEPGVLTTVAAPAASKQRMSTGRRAFLGGAVAVGLASTLGLGSLGAVLLRNWLEGPDTPVRWLLPPEQAYLSNGPWLVDDLLLAADKDSLLEARNLTDGSRRWTSTVETMTAFTMADIDGVAVTYPGGFQDGVVAVDLATGKTLWQKSVEPTSSYTAAPVAGPGRAVFLGHENREAATVYACAPRDGAPFFGTPLRGNAAYGVAVDGNFVYTADEEGYAYGLDVVSGVVRWRVRLSERGQGAYSRPVATGGRVYLADRDALYALDGRTGAKLWTRTIDEGYGESSTPLIAGDRLYLSAVDGTLHAIRIADGTVIWKVPIGSGRPVISGSVACVHAGGPTGPGELFGITLDTGKTLWKRPVKSEYGERAVLAGGLFHFADDHGVVSLEPASGRVVRIAGAQYEVDHASNLDTDGKALYLSVFRGGPSLCSLKLPSR